MAHEDLKRVEQVEGSSDRNFGLVFASVFLLIAVSPTYHGQALRSWSVGVAVIFLLLALGKPALLAAPNRLWTRLGVLLGKIVSPIALGIVFYCIITPIGALARLLGKDSLRLKLDASTDSYWIRREPPGPSPTSMTNQF